MTQTSLGSSSTTRTVGSPFEAMIVATAPKARTFMRPSARPRRTAGTSSGEGRRWAGESRLVTAGEPGGRVRGRRGQAERVAEGANRPIGRSVPVVVGDRRAVEHDAPTPFVLET